MVPAGSVVVPKHVDQTKLVSPDNSKHGEPGIAIQKRLKFIRPSKYDGFTEEEANARRKKE